ncbi:MAG: PVC-type heme-binding CxxCH protein [Isosphaeraceae bacterium]
MTLIGSRSGLARVAPRLLACLLLGVASGRSSGAEFRFGDRTLRAPEGFTIERIAGSPLVDRPITAAFDEEGRLYLADSSGSNDNVQKQLAEKPHRIVRMEDRDGDGRYDARTVFADKMMFPEGTMWYRGSLYVSAPPSIWKLTDTDGDGVADRREEWFQGKTLTGCANDLHGPYLGPDGWIYWCKGAFAEQTYERPGKKPFVTRAAHIFRCRPDGTGIEPVMTGGMDNPVDVTFTPGGERIFSCTFFQHPGGGNRDGLIHAIYGGIYGKTHGPIYEPAHRWTGPEVMPVLLHMGPAAPCGLTRFESDVFGPGYQDNLFACYFNLHKVSRHVLTPQGASFVTKDEDFVTSPDLDFHPTDVLEDADGSLVVVDTGGWYKLCCPSSQLHKPDVLGGVYRVRKAGAAKVDDPRGLKLAWKTMTPEELVPLLGDRRPAVQQRAIEALATRGDAALGALITRAGVPASNRPIAERRNAVWTAARIDGQLPGHRIEAELPGVWAVLDVGMCDPDETVRQAAIHVAGLRRIPEATSLLIPMLVRGKGTPQNVRAAAEALGRIGVRLVVPDILTALGMMTAPDRVLEHSLTYALIEIGDPEATAKGLQADSPRVRRAALAALDQMGGGKLDPRVVAHLLTLADRDLKDTASWVIGRHPEWAGELAGLLRERLMRPDLPSHDRPEVERQLAKFAAAKEIQGLLASQVSAPSAPGFARLSGLKAMAQSGLKEAPDTWLHAVEAALESDQPALVDQAIATARALAPKPERATGLGGRLLAIASREQAPAGRRLAALGAVPGGLAKVEPATFAFLLAQLDREKSAAERGAAADVLAHATLAPPQLAELATAIRTAGPLEVDRLLTAFEKTTDEALGLKVVAALGESSALPSLRVDAIKQHLGKYGPAVQPAAEALYARLNVDAAAQKARIDGLLAKVPSGDVRRGQLVFHSEKAACFTCHAIGYRGGNVGPDLTKVGQVRSERDLLEAIVYPSASFIRSYEPVVVATADGKVVNGLLRNETSEEILLVTGANQEARVPRADIEEIRPSTVSVMPAGLDQQLSPQDLADLVAFLKACR